MTDSTSASATTPQGTSSQEDPRGLSQRAVLLQQLADAPRQKLSQTEGNRKIPRAVANDLGLKASEANRMRQTLAEEGMIRISKEKRTVVCELTEEGMAYLGTLEPYAMPGKGKQRSVHHSSEEVQRGRRSYLLLQLLQDKDHKLTQAEATKFSDGARKYLELNAATARHLRHKLADEGLLTVEKAGRQETYTLTESGRLEVGAMSFYPGLDFKLNGATLTRLVEAARDSAKQFEMPTAAEMTPPPIPSMPMDTEMLRETVLQEMEELRREKYQREGFVPVHEIRSRIETTHGSQAATHGVLDDVILGMVRSGQLRLIPITNLDEVPREQLLDSIPGVGETLFYLEPAHESAIPG